MKARCLVAAIMLAATPVAGAKEPLSIRVSPAYSFAPATMVEYRTVPPGDYEVTVVLIGAGGHRRAIAQAHIKVLESSAGR